MIKVSKLLKSVKAVAIKTLPIAQDDDALLTLVEQAVNEIHRRFNTHIGTEVVSTVEDKTFYELKNENVNQLLSVYKTDGSAYPISEIEGDTTANCKIMSHRSFSLNQPTNGSVVCVYAKAPDEVETVDDIIDLPPAFLNALHMYVAFLAHTSINQDNTKESDVYQSRYNREVQSLIEDGYKVQIHIETPSVQSRGYV